MSRTRILCTLWSGFPTMCSLLSACQLLLHHSQSSRNTEPPRSARRKERTKLSLHRIWNRVKGVVNPPLIGGIAAIIVGVVPFPHKLILSDNIPLAAITNSIEMLGKLYTALQMFVLGGQLYSKWQVSILCTSSFRLIITSLNHRGSKADTGAFVLIFVWRFIAMPVASISTIYFLHSHNVIVSDPVLVSPLPY
jgi:predicted permease